LYGSAEAAAANINPAPITLAKVDSFLIRLPTDKLRERKPLVYWFAIEEAPTQPRHPTEQTSGTGCSSVPYCERSIVNLRGVRCQLPNTPILRIGRRAVPRRERLLLERAPRARLSLSRWDRGIRGGGPALTARRFSTGAGPMCCHRTRSRRDGKAGGERSILMGPLLSCCFHQGVRW
jgi:hypothetical protein